MDNKDRVALATFGDVDFITYGGAFLFHDPVSGDEYLEVLVPPFDSDNGVHIIYRFDVEQYKEVRIDDTTYLVPHSYENDWPCAAHLYKPWFEKDLEDVSGYVGEDRNSLIKYLCHDDPRERAWVYLALAEYYGHHEFDQYPLHLSARDVCTRYGLEYEEECEDGRETTDAE